MAPTFAIAMKPTTADTNVARAARPPRVLATVATGIRECESGGGADSARDNA
jgi:hypothetical protein